MPGVITELRMGQTAHKRVLISEDEYLLAEERTEVGHEYLDGGLFALAAETDTHGKIAGSTFIALHTHLEGKKCRAWTGNMRVRIAFLKRTIHYIPDVLIACDDPPRDRRFREQPLAIFEVISESTEATDQREKLLACTTRPSFRYDANVRKK
jgi:Uma2 family endonuclease